MGNWNTSSAANLGWNDGDVWTATLEFPSESKVDYKYITKRDGGVDWAPGDNKSVTIPANAATLEVTDIWENKPGSVKVTEEAVAAPPAAAAEPPPLAPAVAAAPPPPLEPVVQAPVASAATTPIMPAPVAGGAPQVHAVAADDNGDTAVSTVENIAVEELMPVHESHDGPVKSLANNIVQGIPGGMSSFGNISEEQVLDVGAEGVLAAAVVADGRAGPQALDHLTVSELRTELKRRGLPALGNRRELITRLQEAGAFP